MLLSAGVCAGILLSAGCELCQLIETRWRLSAKCVCTLYVTLGSMAIICQLHEVDWLLFAGCVYSVCYLMLDGGYMSVTRGRLVVVCRVCVCTLSVT